MKKNVYKKILLTLILTTLAIVSIGCDKEKDDGVITIGYSADNLVIERWQRDKAYFMAKAESEGIEVIAYNANEDNDTQVEQIKLLIKAEVDVLVIIPYDKDGITDVVNEALDKGIKVIAYDRLISDAKIDAYISFDNVKVGTLMAEELIKVKPSGNYIIINGSPDDNNSSMFNEGYKSTLQTYIEAGDIKIIEEIWADNWREEPAYRLILDVLEQDQTIDAIIGANDHLADAAIRALSINGQAGNVYVAGHDADISACQRIVEGTQYVTIYKPIQNLAEKAFDLALQLAKNEPLETMEYIDNGYSIPYVKLDVIAVTKENMDETVIRDGFHKREDVYRD